MARSLTHTIQVEFIDCASCGMTFGMSDDFVGRRRKDGGSFYCPAGHPNHFRENENDRIRRERDQLKQNQAYYEDRIKREQQAREAAERLASNRKGQVTKLRNRAAAGVCPCCNRTVSQMARHMATKHPGFKAEEVE